MHCPLSERTRGLVGEAALAKMKPAAYIANTARGSIVDQDTLVAALRERRIAGAALGVFGEVENEGGVAVDPVTHTHTHTHARARATTPSAESRCTHTHTPPRRPSLARELTWCEG